METILIIIHLMIVVALVIVVLLQRSEGGALGIGGGGGLMSARGAANALTRTTAILATGFFVTSLSLGILARYGSQPTDILDSLPAQNGQTTGDGPSLLDQLGGLPNSEQGSAGEGAPAASSQPSPSLIDQSAQPGDQAPAASGVAEPGASAVGEAPDVAPAVETIPANPAGDTPQGADETTVPPVEPPPAGTTRTDDGTVRLNDDDAAPVTQSPADTGAAAPAEPAPAITTPPASADGVGESAPSGTDQTTVPAAPVQPQAGSSTTQ